MNTTTTDEWTGWVRTTGPWRVVCHGPTSAYVEHRVSGYIAACAALPGATKHYESYVGRKGNRPPMPRGNCR